MTDCAASPQAAITELTNFLDFTELMNFAELSELTEEDWTHGKVQTRGKRVELPEKSIPAHWPISINKTERDVYGMEYFHCPAWAGCLALLPHSSCTSAH